MWQGSSEVRPCQSQRLVVGYAAAWFITDVSCAVVSAAFQKSRSRISKKRGRARVLPPREAPRGVALYK